SVVAFPLWMVLFRQWMKLAGVLSWVMTRVILSIFFYAVLTPVGALMRLLRKTPLDLAWKDGKDTYWIDKAEGETGIARYEKGYRSTERAARRGDEDRRWVTSRSSESSGSSSGTGR